jgi:uncharacterized protein YfbU (UPF0304 family)
MIVTRSKTYKIVLSRYYWSHITETERLIIGQQYSIAVTKCQPYNDAQYCRTEQYASI